MRERIADAVSRRLARHVATARVPLALHRPAVSFSFDDIPVSAATTGAALLEARGARGTFYVCGALAGSNWDLYPLAGLDEVASLARRGHEIGCHTASHLRSTATGRAHYLRDVALNEDLLERVCGRPTTFAYPYGSIALRHKFALQRRFAVCRGIHGGMAAGRYDRGRLDAAALEDATLSERGIDALLDEAVRRRAWLTFYSHDVSETPTRFGVSPDRLAYAVDGALARGCLVGTVAEVAARNAAAMSFRGGVGEPGTLRR